MSVTDEVITVAGAAVPVLASLGAVIRYLVQILATVNRATLLGEQTAATLAEHVQQSTSVHQAITDQLTDHRVAIAGLTAKTP